MRLVGDRGVSESNVFSLYNGIFLHYKLFLVSTAERRNSRPHCIAKEYKRKSFQHVNTGWKTHVQFILSSFFGGKVARE
jgi:hypothetical protein